MEFNWYVILCEPNRETVGVSGLIGHGLKTYLPQIKKDQKPRRGVARSVLQPMFRGYAFVLTCPLDPKWARLYNTAGVRGPLRLGDMMATLKQDQMDAIQMKESELLNQKSTPIGHGFKPNDIIRLKSDSPFAGQLAEISRLDDDARVTVLLSLFGRVVKTTVSSQQIELA